jgi:hypothetical protein
VRVGQCMRLQEYAFRRAITHVEHSLLLDSRNKGFFIDMFSIA